MIRGAGEAIEEKSVQTSSYVAVQFLVTSKSSDRSYLRDHGTIKVFK